MFNIKNGDVSIVNDINELNFNEIKIKDQIITFERNRPIYMVCTSDKSDSIKTMECLELGMYEYSHGDVTTRHEESRRSYLNLGEDVVEIDDMSDLESYLYENNDPIIHCIKDHNIYVDHYFSKIDFVSDKSINYLSVEIRENVYLVFYAVNSISGHNWNKEKRVILIDNKSNQIYSIPHRNFQVLYEKVKELKDNKYIFKGFDNVLELMGHDIQSHLRLDSSERDSMLYRILAIMNKKHTRSCLNKVFSPIYENEELNIKAYLSSVQSQTSCMLYLNDKRIYNHDISPDNPSSTGLNRETYLLEKEKAEYVTLWKSEMFYCAVSPFDGYKYKHNQLCDEDDVYRDYGGVIMKGAGSNIFYINYGGIYLSREKDHKDVAELLKREQIARRLAE